MAKHTGFPEKPLDRVFSMPSSVAVLRALLDSREGMSGRAVARAGEINHQTCALAINRLEGLGLLKRRGSGKTQLISLNADHFLIREMLLPLFRKEREMAARIRSEIAGSVGKQALSATLFGSCARGEAAPGSDTDLLLITSPQTKAGLAAVADEFGRTFILRYGIRLSPLIMTVREAGARLKKGDPLLINVLREGIDLGPAKLGDILE